METLKAKTFFWLFTLMFVSSGSLQSQALQSKKQLDLDSLYSVAFDLLGVNINEAQKEAGRYLHYANKYKDSLSLAYAYDVKGLASYYADDVDSAFYFVNKSISLFRLLGVDSFGLSSAIYNRSLYHDYLGNYRSALQDLHLSREIDINQGELLDNDVFYFYRLSDIAYDQGNKVLALRYLHRAFRTLKENGNWHDYLEPDMLVDMAWIYSDFEIWDLTNFYARKAYVLADKNDYLTTKSSALLVLGQNASKQENYELALQLARRALDYDKLYGDDFAIVYSKSFLATTLSKAGENQKAALLFDEVAKKFRAYPNPILQIDIAKDIYAFKKKMGQHEEALAFLELANRQQEKVNKIDGEAAMRQFDEELANRKQELIKAKSALQEEELNFKNSLLISSLILIGILLAFSIVFYKGFLKIRKTNAALAASNQDIQAKKQLIESTSQELRKQNESLEKLNRSKDRLFSVLAHDLRQPFNQILSVIDLMDQSQMAEEERSSLMSELKNSVNTTSDLVSNVLLWSKAQFAGVTFNPGNISLANAVKRSLLHYSLALDKKKLKLDFKIADHLGIYFDPDHFASVFRNVLSNAIKFSPQAATIQIWAEERETTIDLFIKDQGNGMDQEQIDRIISAKNTSTQRGTLNESGTGIGMIIVNEFMQENKASFDIESTLGEGTTFILHIPKGKAIVFERKQGYKSFEELGDYQ